MMALNISSGECYIIVNCMSKTAMDLSGHDHKTVIGYQKTGQKNQEWKITYAEGGWHIKNVEQGKYLSFAGEGEGGGAKDGSIVIAADEPYIWHLWPDTQEVTAGRICVPSTALNVDLDKGSDADGTAISVWGRWEGKNQVWVFEKVSS